MTERELIQALTHKLKFWFYRDFEICESTDGVIAQADDYLDRWGDDE